MMMMMMMMIPGIFTYGTNTYRYSFRRYFGCMPSSTSAWSSWWSRSKKEDQGRWQPLFTTRLNCSPTTRCQSDRSTNNSSTYPLHHPHHRLRYSVLLPPLFPCSVSKWKYPMSQTEALSDKGFHGTGPTIQRNTLSQLMDSWHDLFLPNSQSKSQSLLWW